MGGAARSALELADSFEPDIVLLDIGLGDMDGCEGNQRKLKSRPFRLIALRGYGQAEDRQRSVAAGFDRHLVKPVDTSALRQADLRSRQAAASGLRTALLIRPEP